ncbi:MAG: Trk system potassium transporter TrkA [Clostridia bacterium]|nr:Trk system potassium transporter TrkA [Clostridia bacterium]
MNIIVVGAGKVGYTLAEQLSTENHQVTIIDKNPDKVEYASSELDVLGVTGNGAALSSLQEAGAEHADLLIAATSADEINLLACLVGKKAGITNTIARVRNPEYVNILSLVREDLGLSLSINPEYASAMEMARVLKFPSMIEVDTFAKGKVQLLQFDVAEDSPLAGLSLIEMSKIQDDVLVVVVERGDQVFIPSGEFVLQPGDRIGIIGGDDREMLFFNKIGINSNSIRSIMIVGGGRIAYYLSKQLIPSGVSVKIIEHDYERCQLLAELLPEADIIFGDGSDQQLLIDEGAESVDAFAALTGLDEENIMLSLYVGKISSAKLLTKITRNPFTNVLATLNLGSIFYPRQIASEYTLRYVRALQNSYGSNVETLYKLISDRVEALEFVVGEDCKIVNIPLHKLKTRKNLLIGSINRDGVIITPKGNDVLLPHDTVIVITTHTGLSRLEEITE